MIVVETREDCAICRVPSEPTERTVPLRRGHGLRPGDHIEVDEFRAADFQVVGHGPEPETIQLPTGPGPVGSDEERHGPPPHHTRD